MTILAISAMAGWSDGTRTVSATFSDFVRERWPVCRDSEMWPQVAVLHSEHHLAAHARL